MSEIEWSKREKEIARKAFKVAYDREQQAILENIRKRISEISDLAELWRLQEDLTEKRKEINEKYDYRYSVLNLVFARLICEGWLQEEDLEGLADEKLDEICRISLLLECGQRREPGAN
jgi:Photoprotection regulator fluorescence recovery protein